MLYIVGAYLLDLVFGSLWVLKYPVRLLELLLTALEKLCVKFVRSQQVQKLFGIFIVAICVFVPFFAVLFLLLHFKENRIVFIALNVYFLFLAFSTRQLASGAKKIYRALKADDLPRAKKLLAHATGKNTDFYTRETVMRVCIEHLARGIVEDITAPMLFAFVGGAPFAFLYRTANLLGKRMDFEDEGFKIVRSYGEMVDDILNYVPARLTALVMYIGCVFLKLPHKRFFAGLWADTKKSESLNDIYPQSIVARRLGILLGNGAGGVTIGEYRREIRENDILKTVSILRMTAFLSILLGCALTVWQLFF